MSRDLDIHDVERDFAEACRAAGLVLPGPPILDGRFHRVPVDGSTSARRNGAYRGHTDGVPAGYIQNHKTGQIVRWVYQRALDQLSPAERAAQQTTWAQQQAQRKAEQERLYADRARVLAAEFECLPPASPHHPYLLRKGIDLRPAVLAQLSEDLTGALVVPVRDIDGRLWSGQAIQPDGFKDYAPGGRIAGGMFDFGPPDIHGAGDQPPVIVAEGFATAATLDVLALGHVIAAFQANNLAAVALAWRQRFPHRQIVIAGDNDRFTRDHKGQLKNAGLLYARDAAAHVAGAWLVPSFSHPKSRGTDWNDLMREEGTAIVLRQWGWLIGGTSMDGA